MPDWFDKQVGDLGKRTKRAQFMQQTRRQVLGGIAGVVSMSFLGTTATGASEPVEQPEPEFGPFSPWNEPDRQFGVDPANEHCAPTSFEPEWISDDLGAGVTSITLRPDSDRVYVSGTNVLDPLSDAQIYALDRETGETLDGWPITVPGIPVVLPLNEDRTLYITVESVTNSLIVTSLDPVSGGEQWSREFSGQSIGFGFGTDPDSDTFYLVLDGPQAIGLDATNGETRWSSEIGTNAGVFAAFQRESTFYAVGGDASGNGLVSAIDIETEGTEKWRVTRSKGVSAFPGIGPDFVAMGFAPLQPEDGAETELVAVDKESGDERWSVSRDDDLLYGGGVRVDGNAVYATAGLNQSEGPASQGVVQRLDGSNGTDEYEVDVGGLVVGLQTDDQRVYTQTRPGDVVGIDDDPASDGYGSTAWQQSLDGDITDASFSLVCDTLYTGTDVNPGRIYAIDTENGDVLDSYTLDSGAVKSVFAFDGDVWTTSGRASDGDPDSSIPRRAYRFTGGQQTDTQVTVSMAPDSVEVGPDGETTVDIVIGGADTGVSAYNMTVSLADSDVATISDVSLARGPTSGVTIADDGSSATLDVNLGDNPFESVDNTVATVTLAGGRQGSTTFGFESGVTVVGTGGTMQDIEALRDAAVLVSGEGPPPVLEDPPTDPDGDGLYQDVDGDGEFSIGDVSLFFEQFRSPVVQNNAEFFDFDGDGEVTLGDVRALFGDYADQSSGGAADLGIEVEELSEEQLATILSRY